MTDLLASLITSLASLITSLASLITSLASLITSLAAPARPAPRTRGKPRGIPPPDNLRRANAARMALYSAAGPRSAVSLAHQFDASPERIKRAARRLAANGRVRVVMLPYPGRGNVFCVEVCDA